MNDRTVTIPESRFTDLLHAERNQRRENDWMQYNCERDLPDYQGLYLVIMPGLPRRVLVARYVIDQTSGFRRIGRFEDVDTGETILKLDFWKPIGYLPQRGRNPFDRYEEYIIAGMEEAAA